MTMTDKRVSGHAIHVAQPHLRAGYTAHHFRLIIATMPTALQRIFPWTDPAGRFCRLRTTALIGALLPALWIANTLWLQRNAAEPLEAATHLTGTWTIYFLLMTLALTPLRRLLAWPKLANLRRPLGLTAFCYGAAHLFLYIVDQDFVLSRVASEIFSRFYLIIGFAALATLTALAATSFNTAIKTMGRNWQRLHKLIYPLTALGLWHFLLQSKIDVTDPVIATGLFAGILLHRFAPAVTKRLGPPMAIAVVALTAALITAAIEYTWYATMTGVPADRILAANLDLSFGLRPMWIVLLIAAAPLPVLAIRWMARLIQARSFAPTTAR